MQFSYGGDPPGLVGAFGYLNADSQPAVTVQPGAGALSYSGGQPSVTQQHGVTVRPGAAQITLAGGTPGLGQHVAVTPVAGAIVLTGGVPGPWQGVVTPCPERTIRIRRDNRTCQAVEPPIRVGARPGE